MSVFLSDLGIACNLGKGKHEVSTALFQPGINPFPSKSTLLSGRSVPVGTLPFELPELPEGFEKLNSRNNRLLKVVLDEISLEIEKAIAKYGLDRVGVVMATSTSGMYELEKALKTQKSNHEIEADCYYSQYEISSPSIFASQYLGVKGPSYTVSTACSSGGKALCSAKRLITGGFCDAVIVGGVDTLCDLTLNGFDSLELVASQACMPFSKNREGITIGEGAAVFLVTRDGAWGDIELAGYGESSDAYHISCPEPNGFEAERAMREACAMAGIKAEQICYLNLHGTGTQLNDSMESASVSRVFGNTLPCSSTKGLTGHTLGASGAIEAGVLWLCLWLEQNGKIPLPPHVWDGEFDTNLQKLNLCGYEWFASPSNGMYALMSNSFAFGGSNISLILRKSLINCHMIDVLPHDPPMVLLDRVVSCGEDFIQCQVLIQKSSPFFNQGSVPSYISLEYMAQAVGAWNGLISRRNGEPPKIGFLLGVRKLDLDVESFTEGQLLNVFGKAQYVDGEMASFDCWVEIDSTRVVHGALNVFQPQNMEEFDAK